jgi:hypothetical protein
MEQTNQLSTRSRRSKQQIQDLLSEFDKSTGSVKEFCKLHSISKGTFHKWKSRYKATPGNNTKRCGFAKLDVVDASQLAPALFAEVNGIRIYQPVSASFLKELV